MDLEEIEVAAALVAAALETAVVAVLAEVAGAVAASEEVSGAVASAEAGCPTWFAGSTETATT